MGVLGCDGNGDGTCATPAACGGDVVGKWKVVSSCVSVTSTPPMDCPQATAKVSNLVVNGDTTYKADLTYASTLSLGADYDFTFPAACLTNQGVTLSCSQLQAALALVLGMEPDTTVNSVTCSATGGGCSCTLKASFGPKAESGTYTTAGGVLTETATGGQPAPSDYCVQGNKLQLLPHMSMSMGGMSDGTVSGTIVMMKQ